MSVRAEDGRGHSDGTAWWLLAALALGLILAFILRSTAPLPNPSRRVEAAGARPAERAATSPADRVRASGTPPAAGASAASKSSLVTARESDTGRKSAAHPSAKSPRGAPPDAGTPQPRAPR